MGTFRKIVILAVIVVFAYFALQQTSLLSRKMNGLGLQTGGALDRVRSIDAGYGVGKDMLTPGKPADLSDYEAKLRAIPLRSADEKRVVLLKLDLVQMQKSVQDFGTRMAKITSGNDCSGATALNAAYNNAVLHANNAMEMAKDAGSVKGFEYMASTDFLDMVGGTKKTLDDAMRKYNVLC